MNPNVTASLRPAAVAIRRNRPSRRTRASGAGAADVIGGNVGSSLSKPWWRPTSSMRSTSLERSTRKVGTLTSQPSAAGTVVKPSAREDALNLGVADDEAQEVPDPIAPQVDGSRASRRRIAIDHRSNPPADADELGERQRALERNDGRIDVDTALEPRRGLGLQARDACSCV